MLAEYFTVQSQKDQCSQGDNDGCGDCPIRLGSTAKLNRLGLLGGLPSDHGSQDLVASADIVISIVESSPSSIQCLPLLLEIV